MRIFFEDSLLQHDYFWLGLGFLSQGFFCARFFVQWFVSELRKKSVIPTSFWYLSVFGSLGLLVYSIHKKDPVFIIGQFLGLLIYTRNICFIKSAKKNK